MKIDAQILTTSLQKLPLELKVNFQKNSNIIASLPNELFSKIISYISIKEMGNFCLVSKQFAQIRPEFLRNKNEEISVIFAKYQNSLEKMSKSLQDDLISIGSTITDLVLRQSTDDLLLSEDVERIVNCFPNMKKLTILQNVETNSFEHIFRCRHLKELVISSVNFSNSLAHLRQCQGLRIQVVQCGDTRDVDSKWKQVDEKLMVKAAKLCGGKIVSSQDVSFLEVLPKALWTSQQTISNLEKLTVPVHSCTDQKDAENLLYEASSQKKFKNLSLFLLRKSLRGESYLTLSSYNPHSSSKSFLHELYDIEEKPGSILKIGKTYEKNARTLSIRSFVDFIFANYGFPI